MVRERDPHGVITQKQIGYHHDENCTITSTDRAFNGYYWECYICHKKFNTRNSLDQHLNSPVHKQPVYHCPNLRGGCQKQFITLAAQFNHLESESCGFMRFESVQQKMKTVLQGNRMISF